MASLENQIQSMALAQEKWEKQTQQEFEMIRADHEEIITELHKKVDERRSAMLSLRHAD